MNLLNVLSFLLLLNKNLIAIFNFLDGKDDRTSGDWRAGRDAGSVFGRGRMLGYFVGLKFISFYDSIRCMGSVCTAGINTMVCVLWTWYTYVVPCGAVGQEPVRCESIPIVLRF